MSSTRNNFHQSTRVASESESLSGRAPLSSSGKRSTSSPRSQAGTVPAATATTRSNSPDRRYQHPKQIYHHRGAPKNYPRSYKENVPSQYNAIIPSEPTGSCADYPKGKSSRKLLRSEQVARDRHRHRHLDGTYSYNGRESHHIEVPVDSFHRTKDHYHPMFPQNSQYHYNSQGEHAPWRPLRTTPSPTNHSVVTNVDAASVQGSSSNGSIVDHTYRDFSGVPPSKEDLERYKNKKGEYNRRKKDKKEKPKPTSDSSSNSDSTKKDKEDTKHSSSKKRGRGNKVGKTGNDSFVGFMGTNFPARLHDLLSHENGISDTITWLPHGRSWIVRDKKKFLESVAPSHFQVRTIMNPFTLDGLDKIIIPHPSNFFDRYLNSKASHAKSMVGDSSVLLKDQILTRITTSFF